MDLNQQLNLIQQTHKSAIKSAIELCPEFGTFISKKLLNHELISKYSESKWTENKITSKYLKIGKTYIPKFESITVLLLFFYTLILRKKSKSMDLILFTSLTYEQIGANSEPNELKDYIDGILDKDKNFHGSTKELDLLIQSRQFYKFRNSSNAKVVPYIPSELIARSNVSTYRIVIELLTTIKSFQRLIRNYSEFQLIGFENVLDILALKLDLLNIKSVLCTTPSQLSSMPMLFESPNPSKYMFWYSENSRPISALQGNVKENTQLDFLSVNGFLKHFVWTDSYAKYLHKQYGCDSIAVGPILFYKPKLRNTEEEIDLLIFDVTPFRNASESDFYSENNTINFISDLVDAAHDLGLKVALKPKRKYTNRHSTKYVQLLKKLQSAYAINLINPNVNLFEVISQVKIVVCIPFTSPALVAKALGKEVFYYFSAENIFGDVDGIEIPLVLGRENLRIQLNSAKSRFRQSN